MAKKNIFPAKFYHCLSLIFLSAFFLAVQSLFLARSSWSLFHIDLVYLIAIYVSYEYKPMYAFFICLSLAFMIQSQSSIPVIFFHFNFILLVFLSGIIKRFLSVSNTIPKMFVFSFFILIKYLLFYFISKNKIGISFFTIFQEQWLSFLSTVLCSFLVYKFMVFFDTFFELNKKMKSGRGYAG